MSVSARLQHIGTREHEHDHVDDVPDELDLRPLVAADDVLGDEWMQPDVVGDRSTTSGEGSVRSIRIRTSLSARRSWTFVALARLGDLALAPCDGPDRADWCLGPSRDRGSGCCPFPYSHRRLPTAASAAAEFMASSAPAYHQRIDDRLGPSMSANISRCPDSCPRTAIIRRRRLSSFVATIRWSIPGPSPCSRSTSASASSMGSSYPSRMAIEEEFQGRRPSPASHGPWGRGTVGRRPDRRPRWTMPIGYPGTPGSAPRDGRAAASAR